MYPVSDALAIHARHFFSLIHLQSAARLAELARTEEARERGEFQHELHRACVIGTVMLAVAAAEANINEFFQGCGEKPPSRHSSLDSKCRGRLARVFTELDLRGTPNALRKYETALAIVDAEPFDRGAPPYQAAKLVIDLRNELVHASYVDTELRSDGDTLRNQSEHKLAEKLRNKFKLNPHTGPSNPFFPDHCLSAGCALWALESVVSFCDSFFARIEVEPPYKAIRRKLVTY